MLVTRSNVSMQIKSHKRTPVLPGIKCVPPQTEDHGPDRKKLLEVRRLNQERVRNLTGILTSIKSYFDTEVELRKSLFQEIVRISRLDLANIKDGNWKTNHESQYDDKQESDHEHEHEHSRDH